MKVETAHNMHNRVGVFLEVSLGDQDTHAEAAVHGVFSHSAMSLVLWKTCHYPV